MLETINKDKTATRTIYIIFPTPGKNILKLGRGHEADVRISDISVSRLHAQVKCLPDGYFLEDNHAKFGTLMFHPEPITLEADKLRIFQVGRTKINLTLSSVVLGEQEENFSALISPAASSAREDAAMNSQALKAKSNSTSQKQSQDANQMEDVPDESEPH